MNQEMNKEQAIQLMEQVCSIYKGTLQEHTQLQQAITVLKEDGNENKSD